jgi:hypothetical protein
VGHQDYFLAPLPGSEALLKSGIGKGNFYCKCCFYFCLLLWDYYFSRRWFRYYHCYCST